MSPCSNVSMVHLQHAPVVQCQHLARCITSGALCKCRKPGLVRADSNDNPYGAPVSPGLGCSGEISVPGQVTSVLMESALLVVCLSCSDLGLAGARWRRRRRWHRRRWRRRLQAVSQTQQRSADPKSRQPLSMLVPLVLMTAAWQGQLHSRWRMVPWACSCPEAAQPILSTFGGGVDGGLGGGGFLTGGGNFFTSGGGGRFTGGGGGDLGAGAEQDSFAAARARSAALPFLHLQ